MRWIAFLICGALSGPILAAECPIDRDLGQGLRLDSRLNLGPSMLGPFGGADSGTPQYLYGQKISGTFDDEIRLLGSAEIRQFGASVRADSIQMDMVEGELLAEGNVRLFREGEAFYGPSLRLKPNVMVGTFKSVDYEFSAMGARGDAEQVNFEQPKLTSLQRVFFTTCPKDRPAWAIRSEAMVVDQIQEVTRTRGSTLYWGATPLAPLGSISFPTGSGRRSGFLGPTYAVNSESGFEITAPYYWNIAPNRDLTLSPKLMARRGTQLGGEFRYLGSGYVGVIDAEYLPDDRALTSREDRSLGRVMHKSRLPGSIELALNSTSVSDDRYFNDFGGSLLSASQRTLPSSVGLSSTQGGWALSVSRQTFQLLKDPAAPLLPPYQWEPRLNASKSERGRELSLLGNPSFFDWQLDFEHTAFNHRTLVEGERSVGVGRLAFPTNVGVLDLTPRLMVHATRFDRTSVGSASETQRIYKVNANTGLYRNNLGAVDSYERVLPTFSLDGKVTLERDSEWAGSAATQTLEPRVFFVRTPFKDQSRYPVFDTGPQPTGLQQLFSDRVYSGHDRVGDQSQLTAALTSRFFSTSTGEEKLSTTVAQRYYYEQQSVVLPNETVRSDRESDVLSEISMRYSRSLKGSLSTQYTPKFRRWQAGSVSLAHQPRAGQTTTLSYRYQRETFDSVDLAFQAPVSRHWYAVGRLNYSLQDQEGSAVFQEPGLVEGLLGAEYDGGCWVGRVVVQRYVASATEKSNAIFFQIEFNGLGRVGTDPLSVLKRSIPNYRMINDLNPLPSKFENFQ